MYYEKVMSNYKEKTISLLEIGVNTGNSLELWGKYFNDESTIIGVDKKATNYTPSRKNMRYIIGDATKPETFHGLNNIDIIIDDGCHGGIIRCICCGGFAEVGIKLHDFLECLAVKMRCKYGFCARSKVNGIVPIRKAKERQTICAHMRLRKA